MREKIAWALAAALGLAVVASLAGIVSGGSLDPPGTPGPTMKTLDQVEPRTPISSLPFAITVPGSYYLTGDLTGNDGINIVTSNVTIDLNGFSLVGSSATEYAIRAPSGYSNVTVRNGAVRGWVGGISLGLVSNAVVEDVVVTNLNGGPGIGVADHGVIRDCVVRGSTSTGIVAGSFTTVSNCVASNNLWNGYQLGEGSTLSDCVASDNGAGGVNDTLKAGISAGRGVQVRNCTVTGSTGAGIVMADRTYILDNDISNNTGGGIKAVGGGGNRVEGNNLANNGAAGIIIDVANPGNFVTKNAAHLNTGGDFSIAAGNVAPIETGAATAPWSNVSY